MIDDTQNLFDDAEQDQELLDAIAAAFGADAAASISQNEESRLQSFQDLEATVQQIDAAIQNQATDRPIRNASEATRAFVTFQLADSYFAVPLEHVTEIQRVPTITHLPHVPDWIQGVANLRGNIVSVVDLRRILELPPTDAGASTRRLIITQSLVDEIESGLIVDRVLGIRNLLESRVAPPTAPVDEVITRYLSGVVELDERLVVLLDVEKLLLSDAFRQFV